MNARGGPAVSLALSLLLRVPISGGVPIGPFRERELGKKRIQKSGREVERFDVQSKGDETPDVHLA